MSYDLFFRSRIPGRCLSRRDFDAYFASQASFQIQGSQAFYSNPDTGVYFCFDFLDRSGFQDPEDPRTDDPLVAPLAFNLNYFRPHVFGLEAEPQVAAFVRHFNLSVSDPQISGMGDGEYSTKGFLRGWNAGNAVAYRALVGNESSQRYLTLPTADIDACWRWNLARHARQKETGESVFVPRIMFAQQDGGLLTVVVWPDAIPILLPSVDIVIVPRFDLSPSRVKDIVLFEWKELEPLIEGFQKVHGEPTETKVFYETAPADIERIIRKKQPPTTKPTIVPFDQVLNRELMNLIK
jgi:hypothetical protein